MIEWETILGIARISGYKGPEPDNAQGIYPHALIWFLCFYGFEIHSHQVDKQYYWWKLKRKINKPEIMYTTWPARKDCFVSLDITYWDNCNEIEINVQGCKFRDGIEGFFNWFENLIEKETI